MNVVLLLGRARLRRNLRALAALVLLFALGGGIALAVGAGARRTAEAHADVRRIVNALDLGVGYGNHDPAEVEGLLAESPEIEAAELNIGFSGTVPSLPPAAILYFVALWHDPVVVDRPIVLEGRAPTSGHEVLLNEAAAANSKLKVGDRFMFLVANSTYDDFRPVELTVAGIGLISDEVIEDETGVKPAALLHREFAISNVDRIVWGNAQLRFRSNADRAPVLEKLAGRGFFADETAAEDQRRVEDAMRPLVITLGVLGALAGIAVLLVVGQAVSRVCRRSEADERSLFAAGCGRRHMVGTDVLLAAIVAVLGSAGATAVAIAVSPAFPVGRAGRIEPLRGVEVDAQALGVGAAVLALLLVALVTMITWRRAVGSGRRPRVGGAPSWLATDPARSTGIRFASGRRGIWGTVGGLVVGLATLVAAVMFTGSVSRLLDDPALAGFGWDAMGRTSFSSVDSNAVGSLIAGNRDIVRATGLGFAGASIKDGVDRAPVGIWRPLRGSPWPPLLRGRNPDAADEVLMGEETLERNGLALGDRFPLRLEYLAFSGDTTSVEFEVTVVGIAVSPAIGLAGTDTPRLDEGVLLRFDDFRRIVGDRVADELIFAVLFEMDDDTKDPIADLQKQFPDGLPNVSEVPTEWFTSAQPAELSQAGSARRTIGLAVFALLFAIVGVNVHSLLGFVRQRGRAFAVLKALGFTPGQVRSSVFWQSLVVVFTAFVVALPVGIAIGRLLGRTFADAVGVLYPSVFPLGLVGLSALGVFVVIQAAATVPAIRASRSKASRDLRSE